MARRRLSTRMAVLIAFAALTAVIFVVVPSTDPPFTAGSAATEMTGNATHFYRLGEPHGGCGLPQHELDSQDFVALNVFDTPGDYASYPRPVPPSDALKIGRWENGRNCGRFVEVTLGDRCTGINDGARGTPFCRDGSWAGDEHNGATLTMVVADSCAEATTWCRDDPDHLGLSTSSLQRFLKNGAPTSGLDPARWNNRRVSWSFVPAPNYRGDLRIGFMQGAQRYQPVIAVSHLPNGIHGAEYLSADGTWQPAQRDGDMGQSFVIGPTAGGGAEYQIRVRDASDDLVNDGRVYRFALPAECAPKCAEAYTNVDYTTDAEPTSSSSSPAATTTTAPTTTSTDAPDTKAAVAPTQAPPAQPAPVQPSPTQSPSIACAVTASFPDTWDGGYRVEFKVRNVGSSPLSGWKTTFSFAGSQRLGEVWNAVASQSGRQVAAGNESYNGALAPGASTGWGAVVSGVNKPLSGLDCTGR